MSSFESHVSEFMADLTKALDKGLAGATLSLATTTKDSFPKVGREDLVVGRKPRLSFRGSSPGTPPGVRTGTLRRSIANQRIEFGRVWAFGTNIKYARIHELGGTTPGGQPYIIIDGRAVWIRKATALRLGRRVRYTKPGIMPKRPFLVPAVRTGRGAAEREFLKHAARSLGRGVTARLGVS